MAAPDEVNESIKLHFVKTCMNTFAKTPYTWQTNVGSFIYGCHLLNSPLKLLLVRPTGGGKTLVFTSVAACIKASVAACSIKGITLCITPLLFLGADQVQKIMSKTSKTDKSIIGFHLDELTDAQLLELKNYLSTLPSTTTKTIVLFSSPQCIVSDNGPAADLMSEIISKNKIRFLVFDKIHLAVHYGTTFRKEFGQLKLKLFDQIHLPIPMLFMTTTCTESIVLSFENLIGIKFDSKHWPTPNGMMHRSVRIEANYTTCSAALVKKTIREPLRPNLNHPGLTNKVIVYSNSRRKIVQFSEQLGEEFDHHDDLQNYDIITLVGTLKRQQKAMFINKFINMADTGDFKPQVLCATSGVGNAGIDSLDIRAVFRLDFPPSIIDVCQEKGRAGRRPKTRSLTNRIVSIKSMTYFLLQNCSLQKDVILSGWR
jgi:superfamily II DNA helicase RecQ